MTKPVTVLHVRNSVIIGGPETTLLGWLNHIDKNEFHCPLALFQNSGGVELPFRTECEKLNIPILDIPWGNRKSFVQAYQRLVTLIREQNVQILHTHDWRSDVIGYYAAKKTGIPIMTTVYVWFYRPFKIWLMETIDSWYIKYFNSVTAVSQATLRQTIEMGVPAHKAEILLSGISDSRCQYTLDRQSARESLHLASDEIGFIYTARFYPEKAHDNLVRAFQLACDRRPDLKMKLFLLGKGPLLEPTKEIVNALHLEDRVIFTGHVNNVPDILQAMDVMVHPSLSEGISLAIYEGMLSGLPVIGTDVDGTPEVVISERTGWLVPVRNCEKLTEAMVEASSRPDLRALYGNQARQLIRNEYSMDIAIQQLRSIYHRLLNSK